MKKIFVFVLCAAAMIAFSGCQRTKYPNGNIAAPKSDEAPAYTVEPDREPANK